MIRRFSSTTPSSPACMFCTTYLEPEKQGSIRVSKMLSSMIIVRMCSAPCALEKEVTRQRGLRLADVLMLADRAHLVRL